MTWLGPAFLFALPLLSLPIILHFWRKRRRDAVQWGAMQFLFSDEPRQRNISNIDRWLVLLVRCMALACLIFALARPLMFSERFGTAQTSREDVLILDTSLSTSITTADGQTAFDQLKQSATEWIVSRPAGSKVGVLLAAGRAQWLGGEPVEAKASTLEALAKQLDDIEPVASRSSLTDVVRQALQVPLAVSPGRAEPNAMPRHVWLLTDCQRSDWLPDDGRWEALLQQVADDPARQLHVGIFEPGGVLNNVAVTHIAVESGRVPVGEPITLTAHVENFGDFETGGRTAVWSRGGIEFAREELAPLGPGERHAIEAVTMLESSGTQAVTCRLVEPDSLPSDNEAITVVEAIDRVPILVVTDQEPRAGQLGEYDFFAAAIGRLDDAEKGEDVKDGELTDNRWRAVFAPERRVSRELSTLPLADYHVVVLLNPPMLNEGVLDRLASYVRDGGGLWVCLGHRTERDVFNDLWAAPATGIAPGPLASLAVYQLDDVDAIDATFPGRVSPPSNDHPLLTTLADAERSDLDRVLIRRFFKSDGSAIDPSARVLLRTSGGEPLSTIVTRGRGRVIVQTVPLDTGWTNWMLTRSFVVMTNEWLRYLSEPRTPTTSVPLLTPVRRLLPSDAPQAWTVTRPDGRTDDVTTSVSRGLRKLAYGETSVGGLYRVSKPDAKKSDFVFAVDRPREESDLAPIDDAFIETLSSTSRVTTHPVTFDADNWLDSDRSSEDDPIAQRPTVALWTPLLIVLLGLLVVELMLSSFASIRRFGTRKAKSDIELPPASIQTNPAAGRASSPPPRTPVA